MSKECIIDMASMCEICGKKVGVFATQLDLKDGRVMCGDCASPILDDLSTLLYSTNGLDAFNELKNTILTKCEEHYDENIQNTIAKLINDKYDNSHFKYIENEEKKKRFIDDYKLTTGYEFSGYEIKEYIGVFSGQVVLGTGFLSEFTASFADFFGEESNKFAEKLETAKNAAVKKLIMKSHEKGGNAIIGVDFDYINFHGNMIGVVANGTSVVIEKIKVED